MRGTIKPKTIIDPARSPVSRSRARELKSNGPSISTLLQRALYWQAQNARQAQLDAQNEQARATFQKDIGQPSRSPFAEEDPFAPPQ